MKSLYRFISPKWQNAFLDYKVDLKPRYGENEKFNANPFLLEQFKSSEEKYKNELSSFLPYIDTLHSIDFSKENNTDPYWHNGFFPGLDIIGLYGILRNYKPSIFLEIGSGHSTKVAYKAKKEGSLKTKIVSIDPFPRSEIDHLSDEIIRKPAEELDFTNNVFTQINKGDILFIDSSHRILPNSDCAFIYNELIPSLPKGVIIHIHDIYLPYDYPQFMCDRLYNENEFLASYMLSNPDYFDVLLPNFYVFKNKELWDVISAFYQSPKMNKVEKHGGSIWMIKK